MGKTLLTTMILICLSCEVSIASTEKWVLETSVDGFTDKTQVRAYIFSDKGLNAGLILVACYPEKNFTLQIGTGIPMGTDKALYKNLKYRVDKKEVVSMTIFGTLKTYIYTKNIHSRFISDIMEGESTVLVRLKSLDHGESTARFTLNGAKEAIQTVLDACKK